MGVGSPLTFALRVIVWPLDTRIGCNWLLSIMGFSFLILQQTSSVGNEGGLGPEALTAFILK